MLPDGSGSVGGALVGLALGGPRGALISAAVEPVLEQVVSETLTRRRRQAQQALAVATFTADMTPDELLGRILGDEQLLDLAAAVVAAASETLVEAKIRALGRALATGALASDDAVVEEQRFLVDMLADLEAPHIRLLAQISVRDAGYGSPRDPEGNARAHGWSVLDLIAHQPGMAQVLQPLLGVLASRELIIDTAIGTWSYTPRKSERWIITHTGTQCLQLLEEYGLETLNEDPQPTPPSPSS